MTNHLPPPQADPMLITVCFSKVPHFCTIEFNLYQHTTCTVPPFILPPFYDGVIYAGLGEKLGVVERVVIRLHQEREELIKTMQDFTVATDQWSYLEQQQFSRSIRKLSSCMENCATAVTELVH